MDNGRRDKEGRPGGGGGGGGRTSVRPLALIGLETRHERESAVRGNEKSVS